MTVHAIGVLIVTPQSTDNHLIEQWFVSRLLQPVGKERFLFWISGNDDSFVLRRIFSFSVETPQLQS